eukprot:TRINITY_DN27880_c0_g1_i1.p1 TRINITY_DN27880_c0_g1~~TRINITY_DN27880_c0_g1_i1.p1  ORF type:complete len:634 (+),score=89.50 TRINITY_DN27880_c0_g1_i1:55-1956(+)
MTLCRVAILSLCLLLPHFATGYRVGQSSPAGSESLDGQQPFHWEPQPTSKLTREQEEAHPLSVAVQKSCSMKEKWLKIRYVDGSDAATHGEMLYASIAAWSGLIVASKSYEYADETCEVAYSVTCEGSGTHLHLQDTCGYRNTTRTMTTKRETRLHASAWSWSHGYRSPDTRLDVITYGEKKVSMTADGSLVSMTLLDPVEKTGLMLTKTDFRYFLNLPRMASCVPRPDMPTFIGPATGLKHSPHICAACRLLVEGHIQLQNETAKSRASPEDLCRVAPTYRSRTACVEFERTLVKERLSIGEDIAQSWRVRGQQLSASLAGQMACEDIGCCPLDPDLAESFNKFSNDEVLRDTELAKVRDLSVATSILSNAEVVRQLELVVLSHAGRSSGEPRPESLPLPLPADDKECMWDYRNISCANGTVCVYTYRFGDTTLDESCRLRVAAKRPTTDSDCLWDFEKVQCANLDFCQRSCQWGDTSLNQCCKLRTKEPQNTTSGQAQADEGSFHDGAASDITEDESAKEKHQGSCVNAQDKAVLSKPSLADDLEKIATACFSVWRFQIDAKAAFEKQVEYGLTGPCASCFVDASRCGLENCFSTLSTKGKNHPDSKACLAQHCAFDLKACTGLEPSERQR